MESIFEYIERHTYPDRDDKIREAIQKYMANNNNELLDGLIENRIVFGNSLREKFVSLYNIDERDFSNFKKKHRVLSKDFKVGGNTLNLCLLSSYHDTKDRIFLEFMGIIMYGAVYSDFFPKGIDKNVMKYVIQNNINNKSLFKKHGSAYIVIQETVTTMLQEGGAKINKQIEQMRDPDIVDVINSLYNRIKSVLKIIMNYYYDAKNSDEVGYIITVSDSADEGKLSLSNNSVRINNLKQAVDNHNPTTLDDKILLTLRLDDPLRVGCISSLLLDKNAKYFQQYAQIYIDYYVKMHGADWNRMKQKFMEKSNSARMNSNEVNILDKQMYKDIQAYVRIHTKLSKVDAGELKRNVGLLKFVRIIKDYIIIKIRHMMNDL